MKAFSIREALGEGWRVAKTNYGLVGVAFVFPFLFGRIMQVVLQFIQQYLSTGENSGAVIAGFIIE